MTRPVVVSDSGPLVALAGCGQLELLVAVFDTIHVPQAVFDETTADRSRPGTQDIAAFVHVHAQIHPNRIDDMYIYRISTALVESTLKLAGEPP